MEFLVDIFLFNSPTFLTNDKNPSRSSFLWRIFHWAYILAVRQMYVTECGVSDDLRFYSDVSCHSLQMYETDF